MPKFYPIYKLHDITRKLKIYDAVDWLYFPCKDGGCDFKSVLKSHKACIVMLKHLQHEKEASNYFSQVCEHESNIIWIADELEERHEIRDDTELSPRSIDKFYLSE